MRDKWIAITVSNDAAWERLMAAMGKPEWTMDPELDTVPGRWRSRWRGGQGLVRNTKVLKEMVGYTDQEIEQSY